MEYTLSLFVFVTFVLIFDGNNYVEPVLTSSNLTTDREGDLNKILINQDLTQKIQLAQNVIKVMNDVQKLKNDVQRLETENSHLKAEIDYKTNSCTRTLECLDQKTRVAFYAYYSNNFKALTTGTTLVFDSVITNLGNGYHNRTGIFTTPSSGVYAFTWTVNAAGLHVAGSSGNEYGEMNASIKQNGVTRGSIKADSERKNDDDSATGFVVLSLSLGDKIKIVSDKFNGQGGMYSDDEYGRTSFSGFQIA
ncbi:C1q-related factor-like [Saccostrea cucullata]|uniref:C1q-related factor-like n=1 Tax=Saccostrea cuccullata TaxID=36930 RepID=UPI002ED40A5F